MAPTALRFLAAAAVFLLVAAPAVLAQNSCVAQTFSSNAKYALCSSLPTQGATLHWTYHPANGTADVAYRIPVQASEWAGWGINPSAAGQMAGSNVFIAYHDGAGVVTMLTTELESTAPSLTNESLKFAVYSEAAEYGGGAYTMYVTLALPGNTTSPNVVWQAGPMGNNGLPAAHPTGPANLQSTGKLDLLSGQGLSSGTDSRQRRKNLHGVLNAVSWGILLPLGVMIARYVRAFESADPAWFYLHIGCQCSGYIIGVVGWSLGLKLGSESPGVTYQPHRNIGIALFCLATLQVFALLLRPDKKNKYRRYWNVYHHAVGYSVIILSVVNVFKGLDILEPGGRWRNTYIGVIAALGGVAVSLEVITWVMVLRRRRKEQEKVHQGGHGAAPPAYYGEPPHT